MKQIYPRKILNERQAAIRNAELDAIEAKLGKDARDAMAEYLTLFSDGFYRWLAGLYDAETGALYYSNSGRDHEIFLPDLESTPRGYGWLVSAGLTDKYDRDLGKALPDWLVAKLIEWTRGLQSAEDGYFYQPQWGKGVNVSRRGRDLMNAIALLKNLHSRPLYDTPSGERGEFGAPALELQNLDTGKASALPEHLCDTAKFRTYLEGFDWETRSYSSSNTMESQFAEIRTAGDEFVKVYFDFMNEKQEQMQERLRQKATEQLLAKNPSATEEEIAAARDSAENGLLEEKLRYHAVNGLMKTCSTFTRLGLRLNYIEKAFLSALAICTLEEPDCEGTCANAIVNVFNPWVSINHIIDNAEKFGDSDTAARLRDILKSRAAELIRVTYRKVAEFEKPDGSYGYEAKGVPALSQMVPVAVPGTDEGDVNGGTIATTGILGHMCSALGINMPHLFFDEDLETFVSIISAASPITKRPNPAEEWVKSKIYK